MNKFCSVLVCLLVVTTGCFAQRKAGLTGKYIPSDNHTLVFCGQNNIDSTEFVNINPPSIGLGI